MLNRKSDYEWQEFASKNNLTFKPDNIFLLRQAHIVGDYCGYSVRLDASGHSKDDISVSSDRPFRNVMALDYQEFETQIMLKVKGATSTNNKKAILGTKFDMNFLLPADIQRRVKGRFYASPNGQIIIYRQDGFENNVNNLQFLLDLLKDLIAIYPVVVELGGEVVPILYPIAESDHTLQHVARQLLTDIGKDTKKKFRKRVSHLLCPECWVYYGTHDMNVSWVHHITYYGCRACGQSRNYLPVGNRRLVALLDRETDIEQSLAQEKIQVNWMKYRKPFDFEEVEIVRATDEEVEHFAVQLGNDTDPFRRTRYKKMRCTLSSGCGLSENTVRVLRQILGQIEIKEPGYFQA